ncbi:ABC transporter ATP-binding protein [Halosquirtibacter xylanolyticus]|uniref:ABC transporter ATP-binding protein n=1 Tax=Halosquirtibacter xylanolyticus TaxID=3374599 RepID=UPI00374A6479|nr:ABC transporter ATP-binding protein [Prolixibacteraceae bacterium]
MDHDRQLGPVLSFRDLDVGYQSGKRKKVVAAGLQGTLKRGVLTSLIGSNGTGKSTLLRTLAGFQPMLSGEVYYHEEPLRGISSQRLSRCVSVVLTDRVEVPNATVYEIASLGRSPYHGRWNRLDHQDHQIIDEALIQCGIAHKREDLLSSLSDGERQKVFIAKALIQQTDLIILDEPAAFLDFTARIEVMKLLRDIAISRNISILLSSHDLDLALQLSDQVWLFYPEGPLVEGSPEDLLWRGNFNEIFQSDHLKYDKLRGKYEVHYETKEILDVVVPKEICALLISAFKRERVALREVESIDVEGVLWEQDRFSVVIHGKEIFECSSIATLVDYYKSHYSNRK